jgi:two-component system response regulator PilR (NtrC family)
LEAAKTKLAEFSRERAIYYEYLGLVSIFDSSFSVALTNLNLALEEVVHSAPESDMVSQIKRLLGDLYIAMSGTHLDSRLHGNDKDPSFLRRQETSIALADKYASEALAVAEKINERVEIAACWRIFAQIEQRRSTGGEPTASGGAPIHSSKARQWYKKAIDLFNLIGSRYELAVTRYLAATSGLYSNGERMAMLYLAREYFESEEVQHYVTKIDAALKQAPPIRRPITKPSPDCPTFIAVNPEMKKHIALAQHVAESEMTVLLTGATGTGKDVLARYIHYHSGRSGPFVPVNAAAFPDSMIESELFGYRKGSFTGASFDRPGLFEQADNGTFYLNEVTDASPLFQAKLLKVLETHQVRRLGENKTRQVNFRLIAASNHDLRQRIRDNLFRWDLYYRLNEIHVDLPPLDERKDDIPALVQHFLTFGGIALTDANEQEIERLADLLSQRPWPGNVRELEHEVKRLWMATKGDMARMLEQAQQYQPKSERDRLLEALEMAGGNRTQAARLLGVSEGTIRYRLKKLGL